MQPCVITFVSCYLPEPLSLSLSPNFRRHPSFPSQDSHFPLLYLNTPSQLDLCHWFLKTFKSCLLKQTNHQQTTQYNSFFHPLIPSSYCPISILPITAWIFKNCESKASTASPPTHSLVHSVCLLGPQKWVQPTNTSRLSSHLTFQ